MLVLNKVPEIYQDYFRLDNSVDLVELIRAKATREQINTSIRLDTAYCKIYQPKKFMSDDFEQCRNTFSKKISSTFKDEYKVNDDIWGLDYDNGEGTKFHDHRNDSQYSAIYYLVADEGCGPLVFKNPDMEIEPKPGLFILFDSRVEHGVLPGLNPTARRTCIAMNAKVIVL